jgi:hypothetical protein
MTSTGSNASLREAVENTAQNRLQGPETISNFADLVSNTALRWATVDFKECIAEAWRFIPINFARLEEGGIDFSVTNRCGGLRL